MAWADGSEKHFHTKWECVGVKEKKLSILGIRTSWEC
jgi:hypothetical protein